MLEAEYVRQQLAAVADPVALLEALFAEAPVAFAVAHVDGRCLVVNRAFVVLFGEAPPPDYNLFEDELIAAHGVRPYIERAFRGEPVVVPRFWFDAGEHRTARHVAIEVAMTPLTDAEDRVQHVALWYRDVTAEHQLRDERRRLERELAARDGELALDDPHRHGYRARRLERDFLAALSHELRTPLNTIIGFSELICYGQVEPGSPEHQEFVGDILASGRHLLHLINDMLDLADVEAGKLELHPEPVVVEAVIAEVAGLLRTESLRKRIRVAIEADRALDMVVVDPARFKQVLYNYLSNALKLTPEGGRIVVRARRESADAFRVEVEDSGAGIAPDQLRRLFLELEQLGSPFDRPRGLGLALTRKLVEAQGGSVGVRSEVGHGSVFHAVLPRQAPASPGEPRPGVG